MTFSDIVTRETLRTPDYFIDNLARVTTRRINAYLYRRNHGIMTQLSLWEWAPVYSADPWKR